MPKRRVNISIDDRLHEAASAILDFTGLTFSAFVEQATRELVVTMSPVLKTIKSGKSLQAFAQLQVVAAKNQQVVTDSLAELSGKIYDEISVRESIPPERITVHTKKMGRPRLQRLPAK